MPNGFIKFDPTLVDEDKGQDLTILCTVFSVLIVLSTGSRIAMKLVTKVGLGAADFFIVIALAFNLTANILEIQAVQNGFGRHLQFIERPHVLTLKRLSQYNILFANISLWAVKLSVCFFILSIVQNVHRRTKWVIYSLIAITTTASTCQGIFWGVQAKPLRKLWEPDIPGQVASISTLVHSIIAFTAINSITDLFYAVAPVYFFGRLQMSLSKRLVIIGLTGSGLLVFASSIIRVAFDGDFYNPDFTWALYRVYLCTVIERNLAEVIADLPASFALLRGVQRKTQTLLSRGTRDSTKVSNMSGLSAGASGDKNFRSRASLKRSAQYSNMDDSIYQEDEIPLKEGPPGAKENGVITMQTRIDVEAHTADAHEHAERTQALVRPWDKTSTNV